MMYNRMSANTPLFPIPSGQLITLIPCKGCGLKISYQDTIFQKTYCPKSGCPLPYEFSYKCSRCGAKDNGEFILDNFPKYPNHNELCKCGKLFAYSTNK